MKNLLLVVIAFLSFTMDASAGPFAAWRQARLDARQGNSCQGGQGGGSLMTYDYTPSYSYMPSYGTATTYQAAPVKVGVFTVSLDQVERAQQALSQAGIKATYSESMLPSVPVSTRQGAVQPTTYYSQGGRMVCNGNQCVWVP